MALNDSGFLLQNIFNVSLLTGSVFAILNEVIKNGFEKDLIPNDDKFNYKQFIDKEKYKQTVIHESLQFEITKEIFDVLIL